MNDIDTNMFAMRFIADVATFADMCTTSIVAALLTDALEHGGAAWRPHYRAVLALVPSRDPCDERSPEYARPRAFIDENADLADGVIVHA